MMVATPSLERVSRNEGRAERRKEQEDARRQKALSRLSSAACEIVLLRHGETSWNVERRLQGDVAPGPSLTPLGIDQAQFLATFLAKTAASPPPVAIYSSDLARAEETAKIILEHLPKDRIEYITIRDLRERRLGILQGLKIDDARHLYPHAFQSLCNWNSSTSNSSTNDDGIETREELQNRISNALESIAAAHPGQLVFVVTHGGVISSAADRAAGGESKTPKPTANCSINTLMIDVSTSSKAAWVMKEWGVVDHLTQEEAATFFGGGLAG